MTCESGGGGWGGVGGEDVDVDVMDEDGARMKIRMTRQRGSRCGLQVRSELTTNVGLSAGV